MKKVLKFSSVALAIAFVFSSCGKEKGGESADGAKAAESTVEDQTANIDEPVYEFDDEDDYVTETPKGGSCTLTGTVAGKDVVVMFEIAETGMVRGGYHYGKGTSGEMIELKGAFDPSDNSMVVKEEYDGKVTGTWDIVLSENYDGSISARGTMTNSRGNTYPVILGDQEAAVEDEDDEDDDDVETIMQQPSGDNGVDAILDEYERYMDKLVAISKKVENGDMSAMSEYQSVMQSANRIASKLSSVSGQMTPAQAARMARIAQKAAAAAY